MTISKKFRIWLRRASVAQRAAAGTAAIVATVLLGSLLVPADPTAEVTTIDFADATGAPDQTTQPGGTPNDGITPTSAAGQGGGTASNGGGAGVIPGIDPGASGDAGGGAAPVATCPTGGDQGVTDDTITFATTIVDLGGDVGNSVVGFPPAGDQEEMWQLVADSINAAGGVGCRNLIVETYRVNPLDSNQAQQQCLQIADDAPFLAMDMGGLQQFGFADCIPGQQTPLLGANITRAQIEQYFPYYIAATDVLENLASYGVLALRDLGAFDPAQGFERLGFFHTSCKPVVISSMREAISASGVPDSAVVEYDAGCPTGAISPIDEQQAVVSFKNAGVTHVLFGGGAQPSGFTRAAALQSYRPRYLLADDSFPGTTTSGIASPDAANFDGALDVVGVRAGEQNTPGFQPSELTARCDSTFTAAGFAPTYDQPIGYGGYVCSLLWLAKRLVEASPTLDGEALLPSSPPIGVVDQPYPSGPLDFSTVSAAQPNARGQYRPIVYRAACACWQVEGDGSYRPYPAG
jgi:hypothetical protein